MKITRLYVDNYRCLQEFEFYPKQTNLLMGLNGSGKSSVREVLSKLGRVIRGDDIKTVFSKDHLTEWSESSTQKFVIYLEDYNSLVSYALEVKHDFKSHQCSIAKEELFINGTLVFRSDGIEAYLEDQAKSKSIKLLKDSRYSAINLISESNETGEIASFLFVFYWSIIGTINPYKMFAISYSEEMTLSPDFDNYVNWLRYHLSENQEEYFQFIESLKELIPNFKAIQFSYAGEDAKECFFLFQNPEVGDYRIRFDRLSDGQRVLIALVSLLAFAEEHPILFLDEPQNFVSIQEIQPWLFEVLDRYEEVGGQLFLSSHNSELINLLAPKYGVWLERDSSGKTVIKDVDFASSNLQPAEQIARGWVDE